VYGPLKPRELAFGIVEGFTIRAEPTEMHGMFQLHDGIPLLDPGADGTVADWLLWFEASSCPVPMGCAVGPLRGKTYPRTCWWVES
jgi:hypothetical protein